MAEVIHITRQTHDDGRELIPHRAWCGRPIAGWHFLDAQHASLSIDADDYASWHACLECLDAITRTLAKARQQRAEGDR